MSGVNKKTIYGIVTVLILAITCIGSYHFLLKGPGISLILAVNKYKTDEVRRYNDSSSLALFCFELTQGEIRLSDYCGKEIVKKGRLCGLQNESVKGWDPTFVNYDAADIGNKLLRALSPYSCKGLVVDFEELESTSSELNGWLDDFVKVVRTKIPIYFAAYPKTKKTESYLAANTHDYKYICDHFDEIWLMTYNYSIPPYTKIGEIAPAEWVEKVVRYAQRSCQNRQIRVGLAAYGYNWDNNEIVTERDFYTKKNTNNMSVETVAMRKEKVRLLQKNHIDKYFIWSLGMFEKSL